MEQLDLPSDQQLDVQTEGLLLPQLIGGTLDTLRLSTDSVTLEGHHRSCRCDRDGRPAARRRIGGASGTIRIDQEQFTALLAGTDLPVESVEFAAPNATVSGSISVLGAAVPLSLTLTPGTVDGDLELTPVGASIGGLDIDLDRVASTLGSLGEGLTEPQRVCIADQLPAGLTLSGSRSSMARP